MLRKARKPILISKSKVKTDSMKYLLLNLLQSWRCACFCILSFEKDSFISKNYKAVNYLHAKEGVDRIYHMWSLWQDKRILTISRGAKLYVDLKDKPSAIQVSANNIKLDEALDLKLLM